MKRMFHKLRLIEDELLIHVNSIYDPEIPFENKKTRLFETIICNSQKEVDDAIESFLFRKAFKQNDSFYLTIITEMDYGKLKKFVI